MSRSFTAEEIAKCYTDAMDSVDLINELVALDVLDEEQTASLARNVEHLQIITARDYWTTEDLTPFTDAIAAGTPSDS